MKQRIKVLLIVLFLANVGFAQTTDLDRAIP